MVNELWLTGKIDWLTKTVKALVAGATQIEYTISVTSPANGTIGPSGEIKVPEGSNKSFSFAADGGYTLSDVLVDGVSVGSVESYTFENVIDNHTVSAVFEVDEENPLPVEQGGTGATTADAAFWALANAAIGPQYEGDEEYSPLPVQLGGTGVANPNDFYSYLGQTIMSTHSADFMNQILAGVMNQNAAAFASAFDGVMNTSFATAFPAFAGFLQRDPGQTMTMMRNLFLNSSLTYSGRVIMKEVINTDYAGFGDHFGNIFQGWYSKFAHASKHATGGDDEIAPAAIGAATADHTHSFWALATNALACAVEDDYDLFWDLVSLGIEQVDSPASESVELFELITNHSAAELTAEGCSDPVPLSPLFGGTGVNGSGSVLLPADIGAATADHTHSGYLEASLDPATGHLTIGAKTYDLSSLEVV